MSGDGFFLQAEDGIRDYDVTGVQKCALPIFYQKLKDKHSESNALTFKDNCIFFIMLMIGTKVQLKYLRLIQKLN